MKKIILLFIMSFACVGYSQWIPCNNGMWGGRISSFLIDGDRIVAGSEYGGLFLSTDNGISWSSYNDGLPVKRITGLTKTNNYVFVSVWNDGLFFSIDNGNIWRKNESMRNDINVLYSSNGLLYAGAQDALYISSDNGISWSTKKGIYSITHIVTKGTDIFIGSLELGVSMSSDSGKTWNYKNVGLPRDISYPFVREMIVNGEDLLIATNCGIFLSKTDGEDWYPKNNGLKDLDMYSIAVSGTNLIASNSEGIYLSSDYGYTWVLEKKLTCSVLSLKSDGKRTFAGTDGSGIYYSEDYSKNWKKINNQLVNTTINSLKISENRIYASTLGGVYSSDDFGMSWNEKNNGLSKTNLCNLVVNKNKIFVCSSINGVSFSTDYGNNWTNKNKGVWDDNVISVAYDGKNLFAGTQQEGVFYSSNDGDTWIDRNKNIGYFDIYSLSFDGANLYSGNAGGIYITTNNGNLWTPIKFSHSRSVTQIEINNNHILALSSSSLFQSMDKGSLWDNNEIRVGQGIYNNCFAVKGSSIYLGTNSGVYISKDFCKTWVDASKDLGYKYVSSLLIVNDEIYAGTSGGGLFKAKISDLEIAAVHFNINNETQVVAPNPTSDFIEISVGANGPSPLQSDVRIFDVYGQTVSPAGGGVSSADGGGCIRIDVSTLAPGMYFVRIGDKVSKFVKIK